MAYAKLMGAEVKRKEDPRLINGKGAYVGDIKLPGMQYVAFVRSPYAHARIKSIDPSVALQRPGVVRVIVGEDLQQVYDLMPVAAGGEGGVNTSQSVQQSHYAISIGRVRHVGEIVAAVIATSQELAADAIAEVDVEWEPLPVISDFTQAMADGAPQLFDDALHNLHHIWKKQTGDVDAAFASAHKVVKARMVNQRLAGVPMEGRAVIAAPDSVSDGLTVWTSVQGPHLTRGNIAKTLRLRENQVRVIVPDVGGGFGVKIAIYPEDLALAAMAREYGTPLRWVEDRVEHMMATTHGRGQVAEYEAAVQQDGTITAIRQHVLADIGAYPIDPGIPDLTGMMAVGVYKFPAVECEIKVVFSNTTPIAAYRGAGRPEAAYYIERLMDVVAFDMGMDPAELRRKNFIAPDAFPYATPTGITYDTGEYARALDKALSISHYQNLRAEQQRHNAADGPTYLGIGMASYVEMCGFGPFESAVVRVDPTGTVTVMTGASPHGQGLGTTFAQIVSDQLGANFDQIIVKSGDTAMIPMGHGTMGSRSLAVGGAALVRAVTKVRDKARRVAAHMLEAAVEDVELTDGQFQVKGVPDRGLSLAAIAEKAYTDSLPDDIEPGLEATDFFKPPELIYPFGTHVAVVEIERETGAVKIRDYYTVDDCGPRISPTLVAGQVHGGLAQGIAQALFEEVVYDENGQLLSGTLMDYAIPRADAFPNFTLDKTETPTPLNPLGAKGIGEAATIGSTPAITNAVIDALKHLGVRHLDMPLRSERVWRAMQPS